MDNGPLVKEEIETGAELIRELDRVRPVSAAFWLKASDPSNWYLYIASDRIDGSNKDVAYMEAMRIFKQIDSPYLDRFRIKLISSEDPLASAAAEFNQQYPILTVGRLGYRMGGTMFGGIVVDDLYIYRMPLPAAAA